MGGEPSRELKHMSIFHAIGQLRNTSVNLQNLIDDVVGSGKPPDMTKGVADVSPNPSLLSTLDHSGNEIFGLSSKINDMINELRELIL